MRNFCIVLLLVLAAGCTRHETPRQAVELNNQAYQALQKGDLGQALLMVDDAIKLDREFAAAYANKAAIFEKQGKREEAVAALEAMVKVDRSAGDGYLALGVLLEKMGRKNEAENHYATAVKLFSDQSERASAEDKAGVQVNTAIAQYLSGDRLGAVATLDTVLKANPKMEKALAVKGRINTGQRDVFINGPQ